MHYKSLVIVFFTVLLILIPVAHSESPDVATPEFTAEEFVIANTLWTLLHETAHMLISELNIAVFGHEEDAADQIATITLLHATTDLGVPESIPEVNAVIAAAQALRIEWELGERNHVQAAYWDNHALDIQRFYNMMCLLYGSDPDKYEEVEKQLGLPYQRAFSCADYEHEQARRAVYRIIEVYGRLYDSDNTRGKVRVIYEKPLSEKHRRIRAIVKKAGVAKLVARHLERLVALPNDINIVFVACLGKETAFWQRDRKEVVMCYDLLERFEYLYQARRCFDTPGRSEEEMDECLIRKRY